MAKEQNIALYNALIGFMTLTKQAMLGFASDQGITPMQGFMLVLIDGDGRPMNTFSHILGCDASNITGVVDGMERKGLIRRSDHSSDRRIKMVHLQPKGEEVRDKLYQVLVGDKGSGCVCASLNQEDVVELTRILQKITSSCPYVITAKQ